jgi:prepilin-type N-terminal cleavage/methylation domain-containing protein
MDTVATQGLRQQTARTRRPGGFTFIEVLVTTIVLGLLAALVIPTFLGTRDRANGATAESLLRVGATAMETASVEPGGYAGLTTAELQALEPAATWLAAPGALAAEAEISLSDVGASGYTLTTTTASGAVYVLAKDLTAQPTVTRTCGPGCTW